MPGPTWLEEALKKYAAKLDHVRLRPVLSNLIPAIYDRTAVAQAQNDRIIKKIKPILNAEGVLSDFHPSYYDYGLALDKVQRLFDYFLEGNVEYCFDVRREYSILKEKWATRGLDVIILDKIYAVVVYRCKYEVVDLWTLAEPIEQVILDNEEKSTTYNETGDTGLLLGTVKLPAPKNHLASGVAYSISGETKIEGAFEGELVGALQTRIFDGVEEETFGYYQFDDIVYLYASMSSFGYSKLFTVKNQKNNPLLEFRIYLNGDVAMPNNKVYCRNLVATVVPFYKA